MQVELRNIGGYIVVFACAIILFTGMRLAAPILGPLLVMVFFAILCRPLYLWLLNKGLRGSVAISVVGSTLILVAFFLVWIALLSLFGLTGQLANYSTLLEQRLEDFRGFTEGLGFVSQMSPASVGSGFLVRVSLATVSSVAGFSLSFFYVVIGVLFLIVDGPAMWSAMQARLGEDNAVVASLRDLPPDITSYFGLRTYLNALTGIAVGIGLFALGIDFAPLWAILVFLMSYVPYVGLFVAGAPPVVIALAKYGAGRATVIVVLIVLVNMLIENIFMPRLAGRKFSLSAFVVYVSFFFWTWLLGPAGAMLTSFLTLLMIRILDSFEGSRWVAALLTPYGKNEPTEPMVTNQD